MARVTMRAVAEKAGVSLSTVSRVISGNHENISETMLARVMAAIGETGYQMPDRPKQPAENRHIRIGLLLTNVQNEFMSCLMAGIFSVTDNYDVEVYVRDYKLNLARERKGLEMFVSAGVDGIIAANVGDGKLNPYYQTVIDKKIPLVMVSNTRTHLDEKGISLVRNDSYKAMRMGFRYLVSLGHEKILFLGFPGARSRFRYWALALEQEHKAMGKPVDKKAFLDCENSFQDAYITIDKLCKESRFHYSAIFAVSSGVALGAAEALRANKLAPYEEVSILGYDDSSAAQYAGLTAIAEPMHTLGINAAYMIMDLINGKQTGDQTLVLQNSLEIRTSCRRKERGDLR